MFDDFSSGPRTWKWAVPAGIFTLLIPVIGRMFTSPSTDMQYLATVPCGFGVLSLAIAMVNLWRLVTAHSADMFSEHQSALSITPLVLLSNNLKTMHPEAVRVLNRFGVQTVWDVTVDVKRGTRYFYLNGTHVEFGFVEFVLSRSKGALYPKNKFSEGSKKWDPFGMVEDREIYEELYKWLHARLMVTRSFGEYKPAEFISPWTPALILETMGLTGEQELYKPEEAKAVKELEVSPSPQPSPARKVGGDNVRELTDEEMEAIEAEMVRNASQYSL